MDTHAQEFKVGSPVGKSITVYMERVDLYFKPNNVKEDKQVAVFLGVVGRATYSLLRDLLMPAKPQDKPLSELFRTLKEHYDPKPLMIAQWFKFHYRSQKPSEPIVEYVTELRKTVLFCKLANFLNDALCDRFVYGLHSELIQK